RRLVDGGTKPRRAAQHLFVEHATANAAQEDQVADLGNVDASREQIDGHGDVGVPLVFEVANTFERLVDGARDLFDGGVVDLAVLGFERLFEQRDDGVRVRVGGRKNEGLFVARGVELLGEFIAYHAVEVFGEHASIE